MKVESATHAETHVNLFLFLVFLVYILSILVVKSVNCVVRSFYGCERYDEGGEGMLVMM